MIRCKISGTTASLAGLESGEENAVERILLLYSICFSTGGIPVLNLGDEVRPLRFRLLATSTAKSALYDTQVGQLNDYYMPAEKGAEHDSRWIHRSVYPAARYEENQDGISDSDRLFAGMRQLINLRKKTDELGEQQRYVCLRPVARTDAIMLE